MSKLFDRYTKHLKKFPEKEFIYTLNKTYNGKECLEKLRLSINFLLSNKVKTLAIKSKNSFDWIILYLAADRVCDRIFILKNETNPKIVNKIKKKYSVDLVLNKIPSIKINKHIKKKCYTSSNRGDVVFTSGTTDMPKAILINEKSFIHVVKILIKKFKHTKSDLELLSMPFDHSFGLARLRCCLYTGSKMLVSNGLSKFPEIFAFSKKYKITGLSLVPSGVEIIKSLLKDKIREFNKNLKFFEIGSDKLNLKTREWLKEKFNKTIILHHYGMTEASRSFLINRGYKDNLKYDSNYIGKKISGCHYKINGKSKGELYLKGKNLLTKYLDINENKKRFNNNWFKTGDIVERKKNYIKLIGRIDNQLNIGGHKIQAENLEKKIENIELVNKCICYAMKDNFLNNKIFLQIEKKKSAKNKVILKKISKLFEKLPSYYKAEKIFFKKIKLTKNGKKIRKNKKI